jgi:hypothetical protein
LFVKRLFLFEQRVLLTSVAYQLESARASARVARSDASG